MPIVDTPDDPRAAAAVAAALARDGQVAALVKGSLGNEDLLGLVAAQDSGLRTGAAPVARVLRRHRRRSRAATCWPTRR